MVVWGGAVGFSLLNDGGRYDPASDAWLPITTNGAPTGRYDCAAVRTGREMIVWGGGRLVQPNVSVQLSDGARYDPATDSWSPLNSVGSPSARSLATAVWTGSEMIVWGGYGSGGSGPLGLNTGGRYNPASDSWSPVPVTGAPSIRYAHSAVWSGTEMIVFGGVDNVTTFGDTYSYAPSRVMYLYLRP